MKLRLSGKTFDVVGTEYVEENNGLVTVRIYYTSRKTMEGFHAETIEIELNGKEASCLLADPAVAEPVVEPRPLAEPNCVDGKKLSPYERKRLEEFRDSVSSVAKAHFAILGNPDRVPQLLLVRAVILALKFPNGLSPKIVREILKIEGFHGVEDANGGRGRIGIAVPSKKKECL